MSHQGPAQTEARLKRDPDSIGGGHQVLPSDYIFATKRAQLETAVFVTISRKQSIEQMI